MGFQGTPEKQKQDTTTSRAPTPGPQRPTTQLKKSLKSMPFGDQQKMVEPGSSPLHVSNGSMAAGQQVFSGRGGASAPPSNDGGGHAGAPDEGEGGRLPPDLRATFEQSFGVDLSDIRIRVSKDPSAVGARAYARGNTIFLAPGQYDPTSERGQRLLAHELAHIFQQRSGRVGKNEVFGGQKVTKDAALETEADATSTRALGGQSAGMAAPSAASSTAAAPIQASIAIGAVSYDALVGFKGYIAGAAVDGQHDGIKAAIGQGTHDEFLTALLEAGFVYRYADINAFLAWLTANHGAGAAAAAPRSAAQAGVALGGLRSFKFVDEVPDVVVYLGGDVARRLVLCPEDNAAITNYYSGLYAAVQAQIIVCSDNKLAVSREWIVARHQVGVIATGGVAGFVGGGRGIVQSPQERGDMHDIKIALQLDPGLHVIFALDDHRRRAESEDILGYYGNHARVRLCSSGYGAVRGAVPFNRRRSVSSATETIARGAQDGNPATRAATERAIVEQTTGLPFPIPPRPADMQADPDGLATRVWQRLDAYDLDLGNSGNFEDGTRYIIINYRDSGHNVTPPRDPSHPELDTGTDGYQDLVAAVTAAGFTPVPMGTPPGHADMLDGPNLIQYWTWASCGALPDLQNKRQAEYGLMRRLNDRYNVKALAMRSGATDAMVFAGIETISLDLATETFTPAALAGTGLDASTGSAASWRRAAKRELIRPGKFHQGFLATPRPDAVVPAPDAAWTGAISPEVHPAPDPMAPAPPASANTLRVTALIDQFFGTNAAPKSGNIEMDPESPLATIAGKANDVRVAHRGSKEAHYQGQAGAAGNARAWATQRATQIRNGGRGAAAIAADALARAAAARVRAVALVVAVGADLLAAQNPPPVAQPPGDPVQPVVQAPPPPVDQALVQRLTGVQARATRLRDNLVAVVAYLTPLVAAIPGLAGMPDALTADEYGTRVADIDGVKEAAEFCQFAVKQIGLRVTHEDRIRVG